MIEALYYTIFKYTKNAPPYISCHGYHEIAYVISGEGAIELNGQSYLLKGNSIVIMPEGTVHKEISGKKTMSLFYAGFISVGETPWALFPACVLDDADYDILIGIKNMISEMKGDQPYKDDILLHHLSVILMCLHRKVVLKQERILDDPSDRFIKDAIDFMKENLTGEIDLVGISNRYNLNKNYFASLFKRKTGLPPVSFLKQLRVDMAKRLLSEGVYTITEIAEMIGMKDPYYFSRVFREVTGMSPKAFRSSMDVF